MEKENKKLSVRKQCELLALNRSSLYYEQVGLSEEEQQILEEMDKIYLEFSSYGSRRMGRELRRRGYRAGRLKVRKMMRLLGGRGDLSTKEIESFSHRASDLSLSTSGGIDRPSKQGLGS